MRFVARKVRLQAILILASTFLFDPVLAFDSASSINATSQCYFPGGAFSTGQACTPDAPTSLCCGPGFSCLSNGVCQATATASNHSSEYFRPTCTDQTWGSPDCPQFCNGAEDNHTGGQGLQVCDLISGTYCCKRDVDCCTNSTLTFTLGHGTQVKVIPSIADPATKSTPTAAMSNNTMSMPDASSDISGGSSPVGIAVGLTITILILLAFAVVYYMRRRKRSRQAALVTTEEVKSMGSPASTSSAFSKGPSVTSSVISAPIEMGNLPSDNTPQVPGAIRQHRRAAAATSPLAPSSPSLADPPSIPPRNPARMTLRSRDSSLEQFRQSEAARSRPTTPVAIQPEVESVLPIVREDTQQEALATTAPPNNTPVMTSPLDVATPFTGNPIPAQPTTVQTYLSVPQPPRPHNSMEITEMPRQNVSDTTIFQRHGAAGG